MSAEPGKEPVSVEEDSLAPWEPGGSEYVVRLRGEIDDRWVERFVLTRRRSARFSRFHLNRAKSRVTFVCRAHDDAAELASVLENLKVLVEQTNRRLHMEVEEETNPTALPRRSSDTGAPAEARSSAPDAAEKPAAPTSTPSVAPPASAASSEKTVAVSKPADASAAKPAEAEEDAEAGPLSPSRMIDAIELSMGLLTGVPGAPERMSRLAQWMGTATLVIEDGGSETEAIAALFSTSAGSQLPESALNEIRERFGDRVATLVRGCQEGEAALKPGGDARLYSLYLRHTTSSVRRILCASILRGARALLSVYQRLEFERRLGFRDENQGSLAYYRAIVEAVLEAGYSSHLVNDLDGVVLEMELAAGPVSAERRQKRPLDRLTDELVERVELQFED